MEYLLFYARLTLCLTMFPTWAFSVPMPTGQAVNVSIAFNVTKDPPFPYFHDPRISDALDFMYAKGVPRDVTQIHTIFFFTHETHTSVSSEAADFGTIAVSLISSDHRVGYLLNIFPGGHRSWVGPTEFEIPQSRYEEQSFTIEGDMRKGMTMVVAFEIMKSHGHEGPWESITLIKPPRNPGRPEEDCFEPVWLFELPHWELRGDFAVGAQSGRLLLYRNWYIDWPTFVAANFTSDLQSTTRLKGVDAALGSDVEPVATA